MALTHTLHPKPTVSVVIKPFKYCPSSSSLPLFSSKFQNGDIFLGATFSRIQTYHNPLPALTRRLFLPSVSGLWDALTSGNSARDAVMAIRKGMQLFRQVIILDFSFTLLIAFLLVQLIWGIRNFWFYNEARRVRVCGGVWQGNWTWSSPESMWAS